MSLFRKEPMPAVAAIDIGSNAMRLAIADVAADGKFVVIHNLREAVRLGQDAFSQGLLSEDTADRTVSALMSFRRIIDNSNVTKIRAVGTSALRESANRDVLLDRILQETGISVEVIGGAEEARLIFLGVRERINLWDRMAMLIDIGGGSVEVTLASGENVINTESYAMGAVRLLQLLGEQKHGEKKFNQLVRGYVDATQRRIREEIGNRRIDVCIGTGGSIETLGNLRQELCDKNSNGKITLDELAELVKTLQAMSFEERVEKLRLRPDRADVIVPAAMVLHRILKQANVDQVIVPYVGLKDGLIVDIIREVTEGKLHRPQALASARQLGRKYSFDEQHAETVRKLALQTFDQTRALHRLDAEARFLLEIAAMLHDIGTFVNVSEHHKHSYYLIQASPLVGLDAEQTEVVANVARYHRRSPPKQQHENFKTLPAKHRMLVTKLAAILRVADSLDTEHSSRVQEIILDYRKPKLIAKLRGDEDMMLERWALDRKAPLLEEVLGVKFVVDEGA